MKHWYALNTKPRKEAIAEENLRRQSFETYFPRIQQARRYRGKWSSVVEPLFFRYIFIRLNMGRENIAPIRSTRGVTRLVSFGGNPATVPDALIEALKRSADPQTGIHLPDRALFEPGEEVRVLDGPLSGLRGIFQQAQGEDRAIILLDFLGKSQRVCIPLNQLWPAAKG